MPCFEIRRVSQFDHLPCICLVVETLDVATNACTTQTTGEPHDVSCATNEGHETHGKPFQASKEKARRTARAALLRLQTCLPIYRICDTRALWRRPNAVKPLQIATSPSQLDSNPTQVEENPTPPPQPSLPKPGQHHIIRRNTTKPNRLQPKPTGPPNPTQTLANPRPPAQPPAQRG